jgi:hypothetical protein
MRLYQYMLPAEQQHVTDNDVSSPPALVITDTVGARWCLGTEFARLDDSPRGEFAFNVLRNGVETGEYASRIERRRGKIQIFTRQGWKVWTGRGFV